MGAIQSSINSMLGTAAAGIALGKHAQEQKAAKQEAKEAKELQALETQVKIGEEIPQIEAQDRANESEVNRLTKEGMALKELSQTPEAFKSEEDIEAFKELKGEWNKDIEMAKIAHLTLAKKLQARRELYSRASKVLGGKK